MTVFPSHPSPRLKLVREGAESVVLIDKDVFTIGRQGGTDLKISDGHVSRVHAQIEREGDRFLIRDRNSKSGLFLNGERIDSCFLTHGDRIELGRGVPIELIFLSDDHEPEAPRGPISQVTTSILRTDFSADLQQVSRFLEGVRLFSAGAPLQEILDVVLDVAIEISKADRAFIVLLDEKGAPAFRSGRNHAKQSLRESDFRISRSVLQSVLDTGNSRVLSRDAGDKDVPSSESVEDLELRTVVCIPLLGSKPGEKGTAVRKVVGALYLDSRISQPGLSRIGEGLLQSLAQDASSVLENIKLLDEAREKRLLELELETAREIQQSLLPEIRGRYGAFEICAENRPSRRISGDYYDLISLPDGGIAVVIADISGKGVSAALMASLVQGALFVEVSRCGRALESAARVNRFLVQRSGTNRFVSLFLGILDPQGRLTYINAGHNPPVLVRASGQFEELKARGIVLGVVEDFEFEEKSTVLQRGDLLCLYTDGVTEARNEAGDFFDEERLHRCLRDGPKETAESLMNHILDTITDFSGDAPRNDDLTLLVVRHAEPGQED